MNTILVERTLSTGQSLQIVQGDITTEDVDAIVNAANEHLQHGGGVAWAIVRRGGDVIQEESDKWIQQHGLVSHALPAWTSGGALPAKYIIHAVGPVWGDDDEDIKLSVAITGSLRLADELKCESISMPAISTGIFGFPKDRAAEIIFSAIGNYFTEAKDSNIQTVRLVLLDQATIDVFLEKWRRVNGN
ncbi:MAG: macro domain-containing protein [Anaerolineales bacterium]|nr:macro domain-containing protein [Anaerolineales bacterium]MDP2777097.1 macro domain-containing protein [Anaerolineales bacterium]